MYLLSLYRGSQYVLLCSADLFSAYLVPFSIQWSPYYRPSFSRPNSELVEQPKTGLDNLFQRVLQRTYPF